MINDARHADDEAHEGSLDLNAAYVERANEIRANEARKSYGHLRRMSMLEALEPLGAPGQAIMTCL